LRRLWEDMSIGQRKGRGEEAETKFSGIILQLQPFDEAPQETRRLAICLTVLFYRSSDLAITKHFADNFKSERQQGEHDTVVDGWAKVLYNRVPVHAFNFYGGCVRAFAWQLRTDRG
jgi:hypothetical protein